MITATNLTDIPRNIDTVDGARTVAANGSVSAYVYQRDAAELEASGIFVLSGTYTPNPGEPSNDNGGGASPSELESAVSAAAAAANATAADRNTTVTARDQTVTARNETVLARGEAVAASAAATTLIGYVEPLANPMSHGGLGNGTGNDSAALQAAVNEDTGEISIIRPYRVTAPITSVPAGTTFRGFKNRGHLIAGSLTYIVDLAGGGPVTGQANALASDATAGSSTLSLVSGKGANIVVGEWGMLVSEDLILGCSQKRSEFVLVESVTGDTVQLAGPLRDTYTTASSAQFYNVNWLKDITFDGITFRTENPDSVTRRTMARLRWCLRPTFINCSFRDAASSAMYFMGCVDARVIDCFGNNLLSDPMQAGSFGYLICEAGPNAGMVARNLRGRRCRHCYTTVLITGSDGAFADYGVPDGSVINGTAKEMRAACWDTHPNAGRDITFDHCVAEKSRNAGFQIRSRGTTLLSPICRDLQGPAVHLVAPQTINSVLQDAATDTVIIDLTAVRTNLGVVPADGIDWRPRASIYDNGVRTTVRGGYFEDVGGPAYQANRAVDPDIQIDVIRNPMRLAAPIAISLTIATGSTSATVVSGASVDPVVRGNLVIGTGIPAGTYVVDQVGATLTLSQAATADGTISATAEVPKAAILLAHTSGLAIMRGLGSLRCTDTRLDYGVVQANTGVNARIAHMPAVSGVQVAHVLARSIFARVTGTAGVNLVAPGFDVAATLVSDTLSIDKLDSAGIAVLGEGGAADNMVTIVGGQPGDVVWFRKGGSPAITIKQTTGTGNIQTKSGSDVVLAGSYQWVAFKKQGLMWAQIV